MARKYEPVQNIISPYAQSKFNNDFKYLFEQISVFSEMVNKLIINGQLTAEQYERLLIAINGLIKQGEVDENSLSKEFREEINNIINSMPKKANKTDVYLKKDGININDFDESTRQTFLNLQGIDVNYVLGEGNVKPKNTNFVEEIIIDTEDEDITGLFTANGTIITDTGAFYDYDGYKRTDYIDIGDAAYFFRYADDGTSDALFNDYRVAYYDENENFISGESAGTDYTVEQHKDLYGRKYEIPQNAKKVAFSAPVGNIDGTTRPYTYLKATPITEQKFLNDYNTRQIENLRNETSKKSHLQGKKIAFFGDSIIGNFRDGTGVPDIMERETGATVYNFAFGGTTMALRDGTHSQDEYWNEISMTRIADQIALDDFTPMENALPNMSGARSYFGQTIEDMKNTNWHEIDIVLFEQGTNDFAHGIPHKDENNPNSKGNYMGAYRNAIEKLLMAYPHLRIILLTPTWRWYRDENDIFIEDSNTYEFEGQKLTDFVNAVYEVKKEYQTPVINNYHDTNFNKFTRGLYFQDGVHLNENGRLVLGERTAHKTISIL